MPKTVFREPRISLYPRPVVVVTSIGEDGKIGATTISWTGIVSSRPPVISVSFLPDSFTRKLILESREFVINVPSSGFVQHANYLGSITGPWEYKMGEMNSALGSQLTLEPSSSLRSPRIVEFYLNIECRVLNVVQIGLYDCFFGQLLVMACNSDLFKGDHPRGNIDHTKVSPIFCLADEYWNSGKSLGISTENKNHPHGRQH